MNGLAERMIGLVKRTLQRTLEGKSCSFNELATILYEAAIIVNSRPIGITGRSEDVEAGGPITPLHLMLGRSTLEVPQVETSHSFSLTRRLQYVEAVKQEFWNKWRAIVFQGLDKSYRWLKERRTMKVGDVVLLKEETAASTSYKIARVVEVFTSRQDELVRKVAVAYKNPGEANFRKSIRPVHKLVLLVPVEESDESRRSLERWVEAARQSARKEALETEERLWRAQTEGCPSPEAEKLEGPEDDPEDPYLEDELLPEASQREQQEAAPPALQFQDEIFSEDGRREQPETAPVIQQIQDEFDLEAESPAGGRN